jgi:uncharacterized protein (TIGR03000 family)
MFRHLIVSAVLLGCPMAASAQMLGYNNWMSYRYYGIGGVPTDNFDHPGFIRPWLSLTAPGYWGYGNYIPFGYVPYYGFGYDEPYIAPNFQPTPAVGATPAPLVQISNEFPATLTLQLPAAGTVWVNGVKSEGKPNTEWALTSPVLQSGGRYTFDIKARWSAGGKDYEADRSITVDGGKRSKLMIVSGTEVK